MNCYQDAFFKNIIKEFRHNRLYTTINIMGLAFGLSCFAFILLYVQDELSYDKHHKNYKRIYRLESDITISERQQQVSKSSFAIGPTFKQEFPEIEEFVRLGGLRQAILHTRTNSSMKTTCIIPIQVSSRCLHISSSMES